MSYETCGLIMKRIKKGMPWPRELDKVKLARIAKD